MGTGTICDFTSEHDTDCEQVVDQDAYIMENGGVSNCAFGI